MTTTVIDRTTTDGGATRSSPDPLTLMAQALGRRALPLALMGALTVVPNVSTSIGRQHANEYIVIYKGDSATFGSAPRRSRPIGELGWTTEDAAAMRHKLGTFARDWDDPEMDVYDAL